VKKHHKQHPMNHVKTPQPAVILLQLMNRNLPNIKNSKTSSKHLF